MTQYPNQFDISTQSQDGDTTFENLWVFGKLNYPFENDDLGIRSIDVREPSIFQKTVTATSFNGPATQVTVEDENVDTECFPIFSKDATGNVEPKTGTTLRFNSSNGTLRAEKFSGDGSLLTNIQAGQVQGNSIFVTGMIILWSGAEADIPTGFTLCDGTANTPDLRSRFVVGAGTGGNYSVGDTGGANDIILTAAQMPNHAHYFSGSASHSHTINNHTHSFSASSTTNNPNTSLTGSITRIAETYAGAGTASGIFSKTGNISSPLTPSRVDSSGAGGFSIDATHTHSGTTSGASDRGTNSQGSGSSHENRPPYYALCYIMKT